MNRSRLRVLAPFLFAALILLAVVLGGWGIMRCPSYAPVVPSNDALPGAWLRGANRVAERFEATDDGLRGVGVWMSALQDTERVAIALREADAESPLAIGEIAITNWGAPALYVFTFPPVHDSMGKEYLVELWALEEGSGSAVYYLPREQKGRGLFLQSAPTGGQLVLETCYYPSSVLAWEQYVLDSILRSYPTLNRLIDRMSQYKPFYYKQAGWLITILLGTVLLGWLVTYLTGRAWSRSPWSLAQSLQGVLIASWIVFTVFALYGFWSGRLRTTTRVEALPESVPPSGQLQGMVVTHDLLLRNATGQDVAVYAPESWYVAGGHLAQGPDWRPVLRMHPPSSAVFTVTVPAGGVFHSAAALDPVTWLPDRGDGVEFIVRTLVDGVEETVYYQIIDPKNNPEDRRWHDFSVDLSPYAGRTIQLMLITYPLESNEWDLAAWGMPVIEAPAP